MKSFLVSAVVCLLPLVALPADSPSFRGGSEHPGVYEAPPLARFTQLKWKFTTQGKVFSSPAVVGNTIFFGSADHFLYSVDSATGKQDWKVEGGSGIRSSPTVSGGAVFFTSYDSDFYALDAETGKLRWKFKTAGEHRFTAKHVHGSQPAAESMPDPYDVFLSSPLVWHGAVYFGSGDGNVYALDVATGALRWKFQTGDVVHASPVIANGALFIGSWDSWFYALDAATGQQKWRFKNRRGHHLFKQLGVHPPPPPPRRPLLFCCPPSPFFPLHAPPPPKKK